MDQIIDGLPEINQQFDTPEFIEIVELDRKETKCSSHSFYCSKNGFIKEHDYFKWFYYPEGIEAEHNYSRTQPDCCDIGYFCNVCQKGV